MKPVHFRLRTQGGRVLANRRKGREVALKLSDQPQKPADVVLDFAGVDAATVPFLDELCDEISRNLRRFRDQGMLVVATNLDEDMAESLELVLERHKRTLAYRHDSRIDLLNAA